MFSPSPPSCSRVALAILGVVCLAVASASNTSLRVTTLRSLDEPYLGRMPNNDAKQMFPRWHPYVAVDAFGSGLGQYASGVFTADATSQVLSLATSGFGNAHINGYQLRAIPEPGTGALPGLGLLALSRFGRSRTRHA